MGQWESVHIPKEENIKTDRIAKLAFNMNEGLLNGILNPKNLNSKWPKSKIILLNNLNHNLSKI